MRKKETINLRLSQDPDLEKIIKEHEKLVETVAYKIWHKYPIIQSFIEYTDIKNAGLVGLVVAYEKWDKKLGRFSTYAYTKIWGSIMDEVRRCAPLSKDTIQSIKTFNHIERQLEQQEMRRVSPQEVMDTMRQDKRDLNSWLGVLAMYTSLGNNAQAEDILLDDKPQETPESICMKRDLLQEILRVISKMKEKRKSALIMHYFEGKPIAQIAAELGVSSPYIRREIKNALEVLRKALRET